MQGAKITMAAGVMLAILWGGGPAAGGVEGQPSPGSPVPPQAAPGGAGSGEAAPASPLTTWGSAAFGTTFAHVNGNSQAFRQNNWMDDNFLYGIRNLDYHMKQDQWHTDITARAVQPFDYGANVRVSKNKVGSVEMYYDQFPTYYNNTKDFYNFKPYVNSLDRELVTVRRKAGIITTWQTSPQGPVVTFSLDHWDRTGDAETLWGGSVTNGTYTFNRYPQYQDVDEQRNRIRLEAAQKVGRFNLKIGVMAQDFDGTDKISSYTLLATGAVSARRLITVTPGFTEISPYWELTGDLVPKVLHFEYAGRYSLVESHGSYAERRLDGTGALSNSNHFIGNTHDGEVSETEHNFRLVYTPDAKTTLFSGFGMKYIHSSHDSLEKQDTGTDSVVDRVNLYDNTEQRTVWMGNAGVQVKPLKWLGGALEGRWEHSELDRSWLAQRIVGTGTASNIWFTSGDFDRVEYAASMTAQATPDLKVITRWGQKFVDYDYHDDWRNAAPDTALPGSTRRQTDEWSVLTQYRPNPYLAASYKLTGRMTDYFVDKHSTGNTATWEDIINSLNLTLTPTPKLNVSLFGTVTRTQMRTKAEDVGKLQVPAWDADQRLWGADASYEFTDKVTVSGGIFREYANSRFNYNSTNVYSGVVYKFNKTWNADFRYTFMQFNEANNGNLNDYSAHLFSILMVARF